MTGRSVMLHKKLQELESELDDVFSHPPKADQIPFDDIKQRFSFLSKLLAAEVESQPQISDQLGEIDERLTQLKAAFCNWNKSRSCAFNNHDDTLSICSDCTQALLYDDAVDSGGSPTSEAEEDFSSEKDEKEERSIAWNKMGVFGCGMIVGGAITLCIVVKLFSSSHHAIEYEAYLLPPT